MTGVWGAFLELFQVGLFGLTHLYGGSLGAAILSFSLLARLGLLPLSVRISLTARSHARAVRALQPRLLAVRERLKDSPEAMAEATLAVYRDAGISPVALGPMKASFLQMPVILGVYSAVRSATAGAVGSRTFLWIADLARPDVGLALLASVVTGLSAWVGISDSQPGWLGAMPAVLAGVAALFLSAGFGLYLVASGTVGTLQALIVRSIEARRALSNPVADAV